MFATRPAALAAHQNYLGTRFFGSLNGLRFLCIIAVMWHHSPAFGSLDKSFMLLNRGFLGVDFFFVLSGFLITTLLLREEARDGRFSLRGFYWRRVLRIVPVYFLVVTVMSLYWVVVKGQSELAPLIPYYYLFLSNFLVEDIPLLSITWSLAVEEQYYLIWPALLLMLPLRGRVRMWVLLALIAFCVLSAAGMFAPLGLRPLETAHAVWKLPATSYSAILIGSLAAILLHRRAGFSALYSVLGVRGAPLLAFAVLLAVLHYTPGRLSALASLGVHLSMAACLISIVIREDHVLRVPFSWRPIARVGEISYGIYLYHLIARHIGVELVTRLDLDAAVVPWAITLLFWVMAIVIAEISFRTFERFFLNLKDIGKDRAGYGGVRS